MRAAFSLFFVVGLGQTVLVRYLVGLNGSRDEISVVKMILDADVSNVARVLDNPDLSYSLDSTRKKHVYRNTYVYSSNKNITQQLSICVCPHKREQGKTQFCMVSYELGYFGLRKTTRMLDLQKMRLRHLTDALSAAGINYKPTDEELPLAESVAYRRALAVTEPKLLALRSLPPHQKAIAIGLGAMIAVMSGLWYYHYITLDLYETFLVFFGFSFIVDFISSVRIPRDGERELTH